MCYTQDTGPRACSNSISHCKLINWHLSLYFSLMSKFSVSLVLWAGATLWVWSRKHSGPFVLRTRFSGSPLARYCCQPGPSQDTACWHATRWTLLSKLYQITSDYSSWEVLLSSASLDLPGLFFHTRPQTCRPDTHPSILNFAWHQQAHLLHSIGWKKDKKREKHASPNNQGKCLLADSVPYGSTKWGIFNLRGRSWFGFQSPRCLIDIYQ